MDHRAEDVDRLALVTASVPTAALTEHGRCPWSDQRGFCFLRGHVRAPWNFPVSLRCALMQRQCTSGQSYGVPSDLAPLNGAQ